MKKIGFLSFGHLHPRSLTRTGAEALRQSVELAVAAEEVGIDGAYFRVHHFARQLASPFPLLTAIGARTSRIEIGTGVIDMRYENPLYMAETAAAADLLSGERLQLGISRGSPETVVDGYRVFGNVPPAGTTDEDMAMRHTDAFLAAISGAKLAQSDPARTGVTGAVAIEPRSQTLRDRIWWGSGSRGSAIRTAELGMNLMSSTLLTEDTGVPFDELQAEQIHMYREAFAAADWGRTPRVSVSRSIIPLVSDVDRHYFGRRSEQDSEQVGYIDVGQIARFGKSYIGEPDVIAEELARDAAVQEADTVLVTVPNQLGVDYNAALLENIVKHVAPAAGWR
ncbi:LLM class flavin-dependent oxidoreductase [Rarobacter faecitabidus]|uniref:Alkanesulfonate monooxygenase SsuD/methylene tetrahydromethanopterin reductase-like flavin-dependent oxidoreductase (Luciferase family) n=1 Tax=Rarobacter faecitabidus TaxID=13243 RepID=A0A542ZTC9_RARFA|nr:LLM class flavin-dependent oxidoreductase [Rarobacter faecitabidus]TQL63622.1 alkanesulfonate monooxygenase SsuD/methylene tetrahydromethanopterin reductase-like flavin-dependent oxidoreductase (luciferase family) [Rarobacter faecitabidus]